MNRFIGLDQQYNKIRNRCKSSECGYKHVHLVTLQLHDVSYNVFLESILNFNIILWSTSELFLLLSFQLIQSYCRGQFYIFPEEPSRLEYIKFGHNPGV